MEYSSFLSVLILFVLSMPTVDMGCFKYAGGVTCYQDQTNVIPRFPTFLQNNITLSHVKFTGKWMMTNLNKTLLTGIPSKVEQFNLKNIGLQNLSCDTFVNFRLKLRILNLDDNKLTHFPACSVKNLYRLRELTLTKNFITFIPEYSLPENLENLDVSYNQIYTLSSAMSTHPYGILRLISLKTFNVSRNNLNRINYELQQFYRLENLDMSGNQLEYIHLRSFVSSGIFLLDINLSQNQLKNDIWLALEPLQRVQNLNLSHNQIDHVDGNMLSSLQRLQNFDISYNMVTEVEQMFGPRHNVQGLYFHHNQIMKVSRDMLAKGTMFMHLFELDLSFNLLVSVDMTILDCLNCTFSIHHNKVNSMYLSSNQNSMFRLIDISYNNLEAVPPNLPPWTNFNGSHNPFSTTSVMDLLIRLPHPAVNEVLLKNTTFLCKQTYIPPILISSNMTLDLADNCVSTEFLCYLRSNMSSPYTVSVNISLDRNGLESILECPLNVTVLKLSLKGNQISFLNESFILQEMPHLEYLDIAENNMHLLIVRSLITEHRHLLYLNLSLNNVLELPTIEISINALHPYLRKPTFLDFSSCNISKGNTFEYIDIFFSRLETGVDISNNSLTQAIPLKFIKTHNAFTYSYHSTFYLISSDNQMESIKEIISFGTRRFAYSKFVFDFSRNKISRISHLINCPSIRTNFRLMRIVLNVTKNLLQEFPNCGSLGDISYCLPYGYFFLDFSYNFLQSLPTKEDCILDRVTMLNISHNNLTEISEPIANSTALLYLIMANNRISTISPDAFIGLPQIRELDMSFNRLTVFPESIKILSKLQKLKLDGNHILTISNDYSSSIWPALSEVNFHGNPLVCSCSVAWLRNYTFTTDLGQCRYPAEVEGTAVTCLAIPSCDKSENVYSSKKNIQACRTGLRLTNKVNNLEWDLSSARVQSTSKTQASVEVFRDGQRVDIFLSLGSDTKIPLKDSYKIGDQICLTLSDKTWVSNITECLVLSPREAQTEDQTEDQTTVPLVTSDQKFQVETPTQHTVYIGVIVALAVLLVTAICIPVGIYIVCKRRQIVTDQRETVPSISGHDNTVYENCAVGETSFSTAVGSTEDKHFYDTLKTSVYEN
ncbi:protein artichoke-like [Argopecten irradians]|uniref:protein artichoke-like n=1 Tax=Argopecten irradians TaxID=31199 RepID=UPI003714D2A7